MTQKFYKLKTDVIKSTNPMLSLFGLLCLSTNLTISEDVLTQLSPVVHYMFEECPAPKKLTKKKKGDIN